MYHSPLTPLLLLSMYLFIFFFFNDTATTEIYTLSLHDALPIFDAVDLPVSADLEDGFAADTDGVARSEEHTSELQSLTNLVCRLLLEKKKIQNGYGMLMLKGSRSKQTDIWL